MGGPTTVFVRNLPYTCTDAGLEAAFGEIGPVKESFIVAEKGPGGQSKGFGFVQFALAEDAATAVAKSKQFKVDGRSVTIDVAKQKPSARRGDRGGEKQAPGEKSGGGGGWDADARRAGDDGAESDSDAPKTKASDAARAKGALVSSPGLPAGGTGLGALRARRKRSGEDEADAIHPALKLSRAARSVAIAGLRLAGEPEGIDPEAALEAARACGKVEEVLSPAPKLVVDAAKLRHDGATRGVVVIVYASDAVAREAVTALHRSMPGVGKRKQQKVRGRLKDGATGDGPGSNPRDAGAAPDALASVLWARQLGGCEGAKPKRWRVIIRNLAFKATDEDIRSACSKAGFVWDLAVPRDFHRKPKGFAFAAYTAEADAERAVREVNGVVIAGRQVAVDWALSKHSYAEAKAKAEAEADAAEESDDDDEEAEDDSGTDASDDSGTDASDASETDASDASETDDSGVDADAVDGEDDAENAERADGAVEPSAGEDDDSMLRRVMLRVMDHPDAAENPAETRDADARCGASRREAREARREARLEERRNLKETRDGAKWERSRRVAKDVVASGDDEPPPLPGAKAKRTTPPEAGASVFLRDVPTEATKREVYERMRAFGAVRSCRLVVDKATGRPKGTAFVDFHEPRSAAAAVAAAEKEEGGGVKLAGRRLAVALAVSASEAASLAEKRSKESLVGGRAKRDGPRDNRNLYLASEGQVHEEGPAARGVSQTDIQKRRRAKEEQAMKLKNPNFFISKTRLQVRNVPPAMDQKQLKRVFFDAVKQRATRANPRVTHAKLLFDPTRPDENGKPRSRGIGFVEFAEHEHALAALRALNNNPTTFTSQRRPIVEFAVEDARAVRKLERRREGLDKAQRERNAEKMARGEAAKDDPAGAKKKTRGQKRREREREGDAGAAKKPWGNKKKKSSVSEAGDAAADGGEGDKRTLSGGGREGATTPASATEYREPALVPPKQPPLETREKRLLDADAAPARAAKKEKREERRDATDDLLDRHVAKARASDARGAKFAKAPKGRWFDY